MSLRFLKNHLFSGLSIGSAALLTIALLIFLIPMIVRGGSAYVFTDTIEFRKSQMGLFQRGDPHELARQIERAAPSWEQRGNTAIRAPDQRTCTPMGGGPPVGWRRATERTSAGPMSKTCPGATPTDWANAWRNRRLFGSG